MPRHRRRSILATIGVALLIVTGALVTVPASGGEILPPPTGLAASTIPANGDTTFTWTPTPGAHGHRLTCELQGYDDVIRTTDGTAGTTTARLPVGSWLCGVQSFSNPGPILSALSNLVIVTISPLPVPTGMTASAHSGVVTVSWDHPGGDHVDGWKITSTPHITTWYVTAESETTIDIHGVPVGVPHTFTVTPYRSTTVGSFDGPGATSSPVTVLPTPGAPTITHVDSSTSHITVEWDPPASTGGSPITGYRVALTRVENSSLVLDVPPTLTAVRIDGVDDIPGLNEPDVPSGVEYEGLAVYAENVNGYGPGGSWPDPVFTLDPPSPVRNLFVKVPETGYPFVDWDEPAYIPGEIISPVYDIEIDGPTPVTSWTDGSTIDYIEEPLSPGWYQARVRIRGGFSKATWATRWFAVGTPCDSAFPDVTGPPFCTPISWLVREGITTGFPDGTFKPTQAVTRQAMAAFLYRDKGSPRGDDPPCATAPFPDVSTTNPFCGVIDWMVDEGITTGFADGGFHPTAPVSRQAAVAFMFRAGSQTGDEVTPTCTSAAFPDVPASSPFCGYIAWAVDASVTTGFADGTFRPTQSVTRQSMAAFLNRWHP